MHFQLAGATVKFPISPETSFLVSVLTTMDFARFTLLFSLLTGWSAVAFASAAAPTLPPGAVPTAPQKPAASVREPVWEARLGSFTESQYDQQVEALISSWEQTMKKKIAPGAKGRVGLKVYADSGPGMATPIPLVKAVMAALKRRGYKHESIFIVGLNQLRLRMTGYLPSFVTGHTPFEGTPIFVLESGRFYDPVWFYDSPLPSRFDPVFMESQTKDVPNSTSLDEDRKSFLATPLFLDSDFWINLPSYTDHPTLGVNGALVNATLWNASNTARFFRSPANAPAAVAEMAAIPELRDTWIFTIASLQHYQYIGGPFFNSLYTVSEPVLWLSRDPVMLDALMLDRINTWRKKNRFEPVSEEIRTLEFAEILGVGSAKIGNAQIHVVGSK